MSDINGIITSEITDNEVVLFMKGTPVFPQCGFSSQVVQILSYLGVSFKGVNVLDNDELREGIKAFSNWPTIPQLYVKGEFLGGCDIIREMYESGELAEMFQNHAKKLDLAERIRMHRSRASGASNLSRYGLFCMALWCTL